MMLIGFDVKIIFLIHNRSYVNVMYKELGDYFKTMKKNVRIRMKMSDLCDQLIILTSPDLS